MNTTEKSIGPLKKVSLDFTAGSAPEASDLLSVPKSLEFVFGIGTEGFSRFECLLDGKHPGDGGALEVKKKEMNEIFGHIFSCGEDFPVTADHFYLNYRILDVSDIPAAEVVKSMAAAAGGGCDENCGCGCGTH